MYQYLVENQISQVLIIMPSAGSTLPGQISPRAAPNPDLLDEYEGLIPNLRSMGLERPPTTALANDRDAKINDGERLTESTLSIQGYDGQANWPYSWYTGYRCYNTRTYDQWQNSRDFRLLNTLALVIRFPDEPDLADLYVSIKDQDHQVTAIKHKIQRHLKRLKHEKVSFNYLLWVYDPETKFAKIPGISFCSLHRFWLC
jgi:hypothetical protein